jgi:hypothetical protein
MNKRTIQDELNNFLNDMAEKSSWCDDWDLPGLKKVRTYSDLGLLTKDIGLVLDFDSGEQFQLTIKRSK